MLSYEYEKTMQQLAEAGLLREMNLQMSIGSVMTEEEASASAERDEKELINRIEKTEVGAKYTINLNFAKTENLIILRQ